MAKIQLDIEEYQSILGYKKLLEESLEREEKLNDEIKRLYADKIEVIRVDNGSHRGLNEIVDEILGIMKTRFEDEAKIKLDEIEKLVRDGKQKDKEIFELQELNNELIVGKNIMNKKLCDVEEIVYTMKKQKVEASKYHITNNNLTEEHKKEINGLYDTIRQLKKVVSGEYSWYNSSKILDRVIGTLNMINIKNGYVQ